MTGRRNNSVAGAALVAALCAALAACAGQAVRVFTPVLNVEIGERPADPPQETHAPPESSSDPAPQQPPAPAAPVPGDGSAAAVDNVIVNQIAPGVVFAGIAGNVIVHPDALAIAEALAAESQDAGDVRAGSPAPDVLDVLQDAEGFSATPYCDTGGWLHTGVGFLLTDEEGRAIACEQWREHAAVAQEWAGYDVWEGLNEVRQAVLTELAYMTGGPNLRGFQCLAQAIGSPNAPVPPRTNCAHHAEGLTGYRAAAVEIWDSTIAPDRRRRRLYDAMWSGRVEDYTQEISQ